MNNNYLGVKLRQERNVKMAYGQYTIIIPIVSNPFKIVTQKIEIAAIIATYTYPSKYKR